MKVLISEITVDQDVQIREELYEPAVLHYMQAWGALPPVQIIATGDVQLLADGFHRVEAGTRRGETEIEAEITEGTRQDAIALSIVSNARNAVPLSSGERRRAIQRLHAMGWGPKRIGTALGLPEKTVEYIVRGAQVQAQVGGVESTPLLRPSTYSEIARAPKETWQPLVEAAAEQGWEAMDTRQAVREIKAGTPLEVVTASAWGQLLKAASKAAREDPLANVYGVLKAAALIKSHLDPDMFADADREERLRVVNDLEEAMATLRRVQEYAGTGGIVRVSA